MRRATGFAVWVAVGAGVATAGHAAQGQPRAATENTASESSATSPLQGPRDAAISALLKQYIAEILSQRSSILDVKYIDPDASDQQSGWGVAYKWDAAREKARVGKDTQDNYSIDKLNYLIAIDGTHAFSGAKNNQDLSTAKAAVRMERGNLGKVTVHDAKLSAAFLSCLEKVPQVTSDPAERKKNDEQLNACITAGRIDELVSKEPGGYYYWLDFHGGVEGNQDYSDTRTLFGLATSLAYQPGRSASTANVFDWPFRMLRNAFGDASNYVAPFPSVMLALERLDASSDTKRNALTTKTTFTRGSAEVAFNTNVASFEGSVLRFNVSYRYFHELSPPAAIEAAGFDHFHFTTMSLRFPSQLLPVIGSDQYELFVAYTSGRLPFDEASAKAYELGFATNIKVLGELLSK